MVRRVVVLPAVSADQGDDLTLFDGERDTFEGMDIAVKSVNVVNF
jgi:hypothetical protein